MKCYNCSNDAVRECRRCGRLYCDEHGDDLCAECLKPSSALPSFMLYRGSLLALLIGTGLALWLLLKPAGNEEQSTPNIVVPTATTQPTRTTPTTGPTVTPAGTATAAATATPSQLEYTVQEGDSLFDIAALFLPADESLTDFAVRIANANGLDPNDPILRPGDTLIIPQ